MNNLLERFGADSVYILSEDDFTSVLMRGRSLKAGQPLNLKIRLGEYSPKILKRIEGVAGIMRLNGYNPTVTIDATELNFKVKELKHFAGLEEKLSKSQIDLFFDGGINDQYKLADVLSAQGKLQQFIDFVKNAKASPYEKFLIIYDYVTSKPYKENKASLGNSRDLIALMNGDDVVCVGYANLLEHICTAVGIKCLSQTSSVYKKDGTFIYGHQNNSVYLKDDKYGIDGWYYADACWDAVEEGNKDKKRYNYCLIPLSDKDKLKTRVVKISTEHKSLYENSASARLQALAEYPANGIYPAIFGEACQISERRVRARLNDKHLRADACEYLSSVLQSKNIPANFFQKYNNIPRYCEYDSLLAMLLAENVDTEMFELAVSTIEKISKNPKRRLKGFNDLGVKDIYKCLDVLSKNKLSDYFEDGYWEAVADRLEICARIEKMFQTGVRVGLPITLDCFKHGIASAYVLEDMTPDSAAVMAEYAVSNSIENVSKRFDDDANNCFSKAASRLKTKDKIVELS